MERDRTFPPPVLRWSELSKMGLSPAHFRAAYEEPREPSPAMLLGIVCHLDLLGSPDLVIYDGERKGNAWKDFAEAHAGRTIVTIKEHAKARRITEAVRAHPLAAPLLEGLFEVELAWEAHGRKCGGRIDIVGPGRLVEFKTTASAEPARFSRDAIRRGYHGQAAWYAEGARATGHAVDESWVIAVETVAPFVVTVLRFTPKALEEGHKLGRTLVERVIACEAQGFWPGYTQTPALLDIVDQGIELEIDGEMVAA